MNRLSISLVLMSLPLTSALAEESADEAFAAFKQARGEASWIASGADHPLADTAFRPIPPLDSFDTDQAKRELGFVLFHDARLSSTNTVACNSCHMGMHGGTDNLPLSRGVDGRLGSMNAPTVFNSVFNFRQFWDGRAFNLDEQALGPLGNPVEMGHDLQAVVDFVASDANYARQFDALYPDGVTAANIGNAISQHTRDMTRTDSRFNAFLGGDESALTDQERRGWERFQAVGCDSCHNGINLGGNSYQRLSNTTDFFSARAKRPSDDGLYARTGRESDRHVFKVPSLNNVALTAPYYHDGSVRSLSEAVQLMGRTQAGRQLSATDVDDIVAFLHSLSSEFFASRAPGMSREAMQGHMRQQLQMDHQGQHGAMTGEGGMPAGGAGNHSMMNQHGGDAMNHSQHHMMMSAPMGAGQHAQQAQQGSHGGYIQ